MGDSVSDSGELCVGEMGLLSTGGLRLTLLGLCAWLGVVFKTMTSLGGCQGLRVVGGKQVPSVQANLSLWSATILPLGGSWPLYTT